MTGSADRIGRGLSPARAPRPIAPGERIHVIGAAGAGASAAALLADAAGGKPDGCDPGAPTPYSAALTARSITVATEHDPGHLTTARPPSRLAVTKALTAVHPDHPELVAARAAGIPVEPWQQTVADAAFSHGGRLVAVAGTHGKSTSAGWLVHLLVAADRDPAAFVGALLPKDQVDGVPATARWGRGDAFIVEADEYAGNFDPYRPELAVVLNVEWDHPDVFADGTAVVDAFETWIRGPGADGRTVIVNTAGPGGQVLAERLRDWGDRVVTVAPDEATHHGPGTRFRIAGGVLSLAGVRWLTGDGSLETALHLPGAHNAANAACVATAAAWLGSSAAEIAAGLSTFTGVGRRFEVKGEIAGVLIIDDYGHHPTAIRATIEAVRERHPGRRLWVAHEPLTYHRAAAMLDGLADALAEADEAVIADIWAGRDPDTTVTSAAELARSVARRTQRDVAAPGGPEAAADFLAEHVQHGDVVLTMGGGRSYVIAERLSLLLENDAAE